MLVIIIIHSIDIMGTSRKVYVNENDEVGRTTYEEKQKNKKIGASAINSREFHNSSIQKETNSKILVRSKKY